MKRLWMTLGIVGAVVWLAAPVTAILTGVEFIDCSSRV